MSWDMVGDDGMTDTCGEACDHCRPEILHPCVLPRGHRGYHDGHRGDES